MKIGLLICDQVKEKYRSEFGDYPEMFTALFPDYTFVNYRVYLGEFPERVEDCSAYMATGATHSAYDDLEWITKTKSFIRDIYKANSYFIGFCFGHQLMAEALGGKVEKATVGWCVGVHRFKVFQQRDWMKPALDAVNFLMMCQDQVVKLPAQGHSVAGNQDCPNAIMQIGDRMISVQGHPEFVKAYNEKLMRDRIKRIGEDKVTRGIASLEMEVDVPAFQNWVHEFLSS